MLITKQKDDHILRIIRKKYKEWAKRTALQHVLLVIVYLEMTHS